MAGAGLWLALLGGCQSEAVTGIRVVTFWQGLDVDQLEFSVRNGQGDSLLASDDSYRRPSTPRKILNSGADVLIYLQDILAGTEVRVGVVAIRSQQKVGGGVKEGVRLVAKTMVTAQVSLTPGRTGTLDAGEVCSANSDCRAGYCAQGVCCETLCDVECHACNLSGKEGICAPIPAAGKHPKCIDQGAQTCGFDGTCDGKGACRRYYPAGTPCTAGMCAGSSISAAGACDGAGQCVNAPVVPCAPFSCNSAGTEPKCFENCTTAADCAMGRACMNGSCGKKLAGASCLDGAECLSDSCADGVCCESRCDEPCRSCARPGSLGTCQMIAAGLPDTKLLCQKSPASSCGQTGLCDGMGGCALASAGSPCRPSSCMSSSVMISAGRCDGTGSCLPGAMVACLPTVCRDGSCLSSCSQDTDCAPERVCEENRTCGRKGLGQPCVNNGECGSDFCVDGVCCNLECTGSCKTCNRGQTPGNCTNIRSGDPDPRGICRDRGPQACDTDGTCNGTGGCRTYPAGTICASGRCESATNTRYLPSTCNRGSCVAGQARSCGAYKCNGPVCFSSCSSNSDCVSPNMCGGGSCGLQMGQPCTSSSECLSPLTCIGSTCQTRPLGNPCTTDNQCTSGHCTQGVCCDQNNCGSCRSCTVPGFVGLCQPVAAGTADPAGMCVPEAASTCGRDGRCDGAGACRLHAAGTVCAPASCDGRDRIQPRTCDGGGNCGPANRTDCAPYVCDPSTADCYSTCIDSSQCYPPQKPCQMSSCF